MKIFNQSSILNKITFLFLVAIFVDKPVFSMDSSFAQGWELCGHLGRVTSVAFNSNNQTFVTSGWDGYIKFWGYDGTCLATMKNNTNMVESLKIHPSGGCFLAVAYDGKAFTLNWEGQSLAQYHDPIVLLPMKTRNFCVNTAEYNPDGSLVVTSEGKMAYIFNFRGGLFLNKPFEGHREQINQAMFDASGNFVGTASDDHTAKIWTLNGECIKTLNGHTETVCSIAFNKVFRENRYVSDRIVTASGDHTAKIWDFDGNCLVTLIGHKGKVSSAFFSKNGDRVVTAAHDKLVKIWDSTTGRCLATLVGHTFYVTLAVFDDSGKYVISTAADGPSPILWKLK